MNVCNMHAGLSCQSHLQRFSVADRADINICCLDIKSMHHALVLLLTIQDSSTKAVMIQTELQSLIATARDKDA